MGRRYTYLVEDVSLRMGKSGFAVGAKVEVWAIDAAPSDTANRHGVAAVTCYASVNDTLVSTDPQVSRSPSRFHPDGRRVRATQTNLPRTVFSNMI